MLLRLDRITDEQRLQIVLLVDQMIYTTDTKKLYIGDGVTFGGLDLFDMIVDSRIPKNTLTVQFMTNVERENNVVPPSQVVYTTDTKKLYIGDGFTTGGLLISPTTLINNTTNLTKVTNSTLSATINTLYSDNINSLDRSVKINDSVHIANNSVQFYNDKNSDENFGNFLSSHNKIIGEHQIRPNASYTYRGDLEHSTIATTNLQSIKVGDELVVNTILGYDGNDWINAGVIAAEAEVVQPNNINAKIAIYPVVNNSPATGKGITISINGVSVNKNVDEPIEADLDINGILKLSVASAEPANPKDGMIAIADGQGWNPVGTGKQALVVRLAGIWVQLAVAP